MARDPLFRHTDFYNITEGPLEVGGEGGLNTTTP